MNVLEIFGMAFAMGIVSALFCVFCLVALPSWLYGQIPAVKRRREAQERERQEFSACSADLVELDKNMTKENVESFLVKWPDWKRTLTANAWFCRIMYESGFWPLEDFEARLNKAIKEDRHDGRGDFLGGVQVDDVRGDGSLLRADRVDVGVRGAF